MHPLYEEFLAYLTRKDKAACVDLVLGRLAREEIDVVTLYRDVLGPALRSDACSDDLALCIWEEHVRTSIVRTILECCYPFIIKERDQAHAAADRGGVLIVCPAEEFHEIGPRMAADFFTLCGFDVVFAGANTPQEEILNAIGRLRPRYVGIGVASSYNLVAARRTIKRLLAVRQDTGGDFEILAGGNAFRQNPGLYLRMGADIYVDTYDDVRDLGYGT